MCWRQAYVATELLVILFTHISSARSLLIVHGLCDDNVLYEHSVALVRELLFHNVTNFEFVSPLLTWFL